MMTSSNGNIFRVTGHLCGVFTGPRWIPRTKASGAELWCFLWSAPVSDGHPILHKDPLANVLTHWGRDKIDAISQTTFSNTFSWMKIFEFRLKFHWSLFPRVRLTIFQHWFRWWLGAVQATGHYLNQWWLIYRRIYASLGLNELTTMARHQINGCNEGWRGRGEGQNRVIHINPNMKYYFRFTAMTHHIRTSSPSTQA